MLIPVLVGEFTPHPPLPNLCWILNNNFLGFLSENEPSVSCSSLFNIQNGGIFRVEEESASLSLIKS